MVDVGHECLIISKTNSNGENNIDIFNMAVCVTDFTHFETGYVGTVYIKSTQIL